VSLRVKYEDELISGCPGNRCMGGTFLRRPTLNWIRKLHLACFTSSLPLMKVLRSTNIRSILFPPMSSSIAYTCYTCSSNNQSIHFFLFPLSSLLFSLPIDHTHTTHTTHTLHTTHGAICGHAAMRKDPLLKSFCKLRTPASYPPFTLRLPAQ
jgi:hypothetical protein